MSTPLKTYRVSFTVHDCYFIDLKAKSEDDAILKAEDLYEREGEKAFEFDISDGGTDDWDAKVIA